MYLEATSQNTLLFVTRPAGPSRATADAPIAGQEPEAGPPPSPSQPGGDAPGTVEGGRAAPLSIGPEGLALLQAPRDGRNEPRRGPDDPTRPDAIPSRASNRSGEEGREDGPDGLTDAEREQVRDLQRREAEVRRHENAHAAAGGPYAGAPSYQYQRGPDNRLYAVGGEVSIDAAPVPNNPEATIAKMRTVRRAALAPADPSPQDARVAAQAQQEISAAQSELRDERLEEQQRPVGSSETIDGPPDAEAAPADGNLVAFEDMAQRALASRRAFAETLAGRDEAVPAPGTLYAPDGSPIARAPIDIRA
ncbi:hypothetical protein KAJ83_18430 [Marivibrio halodurans]|uniref:SprA-related family protein n=1 Tax=Marivibrio halodurans TaxID=2039722 RepID=A0A8J7S5R2_9PROT|nr:putative metalloprotease CJM1_0395 family protein [Marivibrio halodurans]MBP5859003.1 hypothetical protein [Marivibrio halodurans]